MKGIKDKIKNNQGVTLGKHLIIAFCVSLCISAFLAYIFYSQSNKATSFSPYLFSTNTLLGVILSFAIYMTNYGVVSLFDKVFFQNKKKQFWQRQVVFVLSGITVSIISYYVFLALLLKLFYKVSFIDFFTSERFTFLNFLYIILISIFVLLTVLAFILYDRIKNLAIRKEQIEVALKQAEINSLKEQLSPHFLFNNLNVLISIIQEDPQKAEQFARSFTNIYRYVLEQIENSKTTVGEEMRFARDYMYLMNVRYENAIDFVVSKEVENFYNYSMPALAMQTILENIIKHNAIPPQDKLNVSISIVDNEFLVIKNDKLSKVEDTYSSKLGLRNLKSRYALAYHKEVLVENSEKYFMIKLPIEML
ncbi:hypothetical protein SAMN05421818_102129 [Myroides phaeus]|uniref:Signal transduction histidine kinase internal region domain-containing protein n=1 Tax=Myroides phaeus TaxID=702745 RepID=A0A1G8BLV3_9FLAO|nr:hypothetical protein SAMN05421818_102129 [Myroides phaeus]